MQEQPEFQAVGGQLHRVVYQEVDESSVEADLLAQLDAAQTHLNEATQGREQAEQVYANAEAAAEEAANQLELKKQEVELAVTISPEQSNWLLNNLSKETLMRALPTLLGTTKTSQPPPANPSMSPSPPSANRLIKDPRSGKLTTPGSVNPLWSKFKNL